MTFSQFENVQKLSIITIPIFNFLTFFPEQEVQRLEVLCKQLYESQDAAARSEAEKALVTFQNSGDRYNLNFKLFLGGCGKLL